MNVQTHSGYAMGIKQLTEPEVHAAYAQFYANGETYLPQLGGPPISIEQWRDRELARIANEGRQPDPVPNSGPAVWPIVIEDMRARDNVGRKRYGTPLQPHNGRDALRDAYEEALDLVVYLRQALYERDGK